MSEPKYQQVVRHQLLFGANQMEDEKEYIAYLTQLSAYSFGTLIANMTRRRGENPTDGVLEWMKTVNQVLLPEGTQVKVTLIEPTGDQDG
jgi:hypothetical protein